ncbi:hypothetical protein ACE10Z_36565 [Bradyrhizobium sp. Pha-3]|uniref:hypothetical protein n=1 Tax=Bradyrhizobium sp. Pha-3 TaxID=208375 RepID=UPI0035D3E91F
MKLIRLILIDLVLMLPAPEIAEAMNMGVAAIVTLATKAVAPFKRTAGAEAVSRKRQLSSQTMQALPATLEPALSMSSTSARGSVRLPALKMPAAVTPSIRNPATAPYGLLGTEKPRWSEADRIVGGVVIFAFAAIPLVILMEGYSTGTDT